MLCGDVSEAACDIGTAGEHHTFDPRTDRPQRGPDFVATIEKGREPGLGNHFARSRDDFAKPAGSDIATGSRRASEHDRPAGPRRCLQRRSRVDERVDDNDGPSR